MAKPNDNLYKSEGTLAHDGLGTGDFMAETDYRGLFSPARQQITKGDINGVGKNVFDLSSYYWYPEDFEKMLYFDDLYNSIATDRGILKDLPEQGTGPIGMTINQVQKSADKYKKLGNAMIGKVSKDDVAKVFEKPPQLNQDLLATVPNIKITEYQPQSEIGSTVDKMKKMWEIIESLTQSNSDGAGAGALDKIIHTFSPKGLKEIINKTFDRPSNSNAEMDNIINIPNFFYENMIGGTYTAQYHVPMLDNDNYLNAMGQTGWESRSLKQQFFGKMISGLVDKIPGLGGLDIAGKPKFNLDGNNPVPDSVNTTFMLYNYNIDALVANIKFIHALTSGAYWLQSGFLQLPSNLYDIEVEGRYRHYLCKGNIKIDFVGKVRTLGATSIQLSKILAAMPGVQNNKAFTKVPDAYKITLEFQSLLPNNFNTYLNYLYGKNPVAVGNTKDDKLGSLLAKVQDQINSTPTEKQNESLTPAN